MKLEICEKGLKEYYDEFLYIISRFRYLKKKPYKKVHRLTVYLSFYGLFVLLAIILFILFYVESSNILFIFLMGILSLLFIYTIFYIRWVKKQIKVFQKNSKKIIEITQKKIEYRDDNKVLKIEWTNIELVLISKYGIAFLPIENTKPFISISNKYKKDIVEVVKKFGYQDKLIDNSLKYLT